MVSPAGLMSAMTTRHPLERRCLVNSSPMPEAAPVTIAPGFDISIEQDEQGEFEGRVKEETGRDVGESRSSIVIARESSKA